MSPVWRGVTLVGGTCNVSVSIVVSTACVTCVERCPPVKWLLQGFSKYCSVYCLCHLTHISIQKLHRTQITVLQMNVRSPLRS